MAIQALNLQETFAVLKSDLSVDTVRVTPNIYEELAQNFDSFKDHMLVSEYEFSQPWSSWEQHPAGDELVILLAGSATVRLLTDAGEETVTVDKVGAYVVIPGNTWHTAETLEQTRMLLVTPGEGTKNTEEIENATQEAD